MAECLHGLDESWCSLCLHPRRRDDAPVLTMALFKAKWPGFCKPCETSIEVGQMIYKLSDGTYVHESCE